MKTRAWLVSGLVCFIAGPVVSQSFEKQVAQGIRKVSQSAGKIRLALADSKERVAAVEGVDKAGIEWVSIPGGTFRMGSDKGDWNERPVHEVTVKGFKISKTEVTVKQYKACVDAGECVEPVPSLTLQF